MKIDERSLAASSYIINFYKEVYQLKHHFLIYSNLLIQLYSMVNKEADDKVQIPEDYKPQLLQAAMDLRYFIQASYISYISIINNIRLENELLSSFEKLKKQLIIIEDDVLEYLNCINNFLLMDIVQSLMQSSQQIVSDIYDVSKESEPSEQPQE